MKKILLFASALAGLFLAGSCQRENLEPEQTGKQVTFTVEAPAAMQTKAIADGKNVDQLIYEVWITGQSPNVTDLSGATRLYQAATQMAPAADGKVKATITLDLVNDQNFTVLFWAQKKDINVYNTSWLNAVTYTNTAAEAYSANDNRLDAFYGKAFVSDGQTATPTVTLKRPFAQVNLCTLNSKDAAQTSDNYNISLVSSKMRLDAVPTTFNVATSAVSNYVAMEFAANTVPSGDDEMITVNGKEYYYAGMNYVFAGANIVLTYDIQTKLNETVDANVNNTIQNVPLKENYRTNIVGNLLTSKVDYEIIVDAEFNTPAEVVEMWNGSEVNEPKQSATDANVYEIEFPSELAWLAAAVNGTLPETKATVEPQDFAGKTFKLMNDIDLCGHEWTPIGNGKHFKGTFDGQGHTISGMTITDHAGQNQKALFGTVSGTPTIKNLVIDNASVVMPAGFKGDYYAAGLVGTYYGTLTVENVTVKNSTFAGNNKVAGLLAHDGVCSNLKIDNCHVLNCNISSTNLVDGGNVGGLLGLFQGQADGEYKITRSSVKGSTIVGINSSNTGKRANGEFVACISSKAGQTLVIENCEVDGNTFTQTVDGSTAVTYVGPYDNKFVGGERNDYEVLPGVVIIDGAIYVTTAANLQAVLNAATSDVTVKFGADIEGDVMICEKEGVDIVIDGVEKNYDGTIKVHNASTPNTGSLSVRNVNFSTAKVYYDSDGKPYFYFVQADDFGVIDGVTCRYSQNVTVDGCTFTTTNEEVANYAAGVFVRSSKNAKVLNCTATGVHSLIQAQSCDETVEVKECTVNGKNGIAFKAVKNAVVEECNITATEYGIRFDGDQNNYGITVNGATINAKQPLIVRKMTGANNTIALEGTNTLTTEAEYQIVITKDSDDQPYVKPTGTYTLTGADAYSVFPSAYPVATWDSFTAALAAGEDWIKLTADITYDANYQLQKAVILDLNGKSMTLPMINIHTKTTVKNGTINGKVYARKNSDIVFDNVKFSGAVSDNLSTEGHLAIQSGCKLYVKGCIFSPTSVSGSQTKPISFEGGSSTMKFENCEFKSSPYKKQVYFNSLSATATLDFTNCNFNNKTPNIMFAAACPLTNLTMSGTTKLGSVTLETNRAKDAVTADDLAYLRTMIANNSISSVRLFYAGGSSEYIR